MNRETRERIFERDDYRCWYCGHALSRDYRAIYRSRNLSVKELKDAATVDHLAPASAGGGEGDDNLVTACFPCNAQKRDKSVEEYRAYLRRKQSPHVRAAELITLATTEVEFPEDLSGHIETTLRWLESLTPQIIFYGERGQV
jgi:5-methylcytosine-specific restriction endonuclease McrA